MRKRVRLLGARGGKRLRSQRLIPLRRQSEVEARGCRVLVILVENATLYDRLTVLEVAGLSILQVAVAAGTF